MKIFNDLDEIYSQGILEQEDGYGCTVCKKVYKRHGNAVAHVSSRSCHSYKEVFHKTLAEDLFLHIHNNVAALAGVRAFKRIERFRKSPSYSQVAKFYLYCMSNGIREPIDYIEFLYLHIKPRNPFKLYAIGQKETVLQEFYIWRRKNGSSDQERFIDSNRERLETDNEFVLRSLEKGEVTIKFLSEQFNTERFVETINEYQVKRLEKYLEVFVYGTD